MVDLEYAGPAGRIYPYHDRDDTFLQRVVTTVYFLSLPCFLLMFKWIKSGLDLNELVRLGPANWAWLAGLAKFDVTANRAKIEFDLG